ncbi:MAG: hypothetical protein AAGJ40_09500 [Planctomycetota bacterium]
MDETEMPKPLVDRLHSYLDALENAADKASGVFVEQAPEVAREYLDWYFWHSIFFAGVGMLGLLAGVYIYPLLRYLSRNAEADSRTVASVFGFFASFIAIAVFAGMTVSSFSSIVKVTAAPRVVLLEKVAELSGR